jgi:ABC-type phosphate/phosphonate transport system permease subunit
MEFRLAMSHFKFTEVTLILFWYLLLVLFVDIVSAQLRKLAN